MMMSAGEVIKIQYTLKKDSLIKLFLQVKKMNVI